MKLTETEMYGVFGGPQNVYHLNSCTESIGGQGGNNFVFFAKNEKKKIQHNLLPTHFALDFANRIKQCSCFFILTLFSTLLWLRCLLLLVVRIFVIFFFCGFDFHYK